MAKIAFIDVTATISYGGIQTAVWSLAQVIVSKGHEVTVVGGSSEERRDYPDGVRRLTFPYIARNRFPNFGNRFRKLAERLSFAYHARRSIQREKFDWIILTKPFDFFWPRIIGRNDHTRFAFMSGGTDFIALDRYFAARINVWLACSHFNAWQIQTRYRRFPKVMFNGVDTTIFKPANGSMVRENLGLQKDDIVFAYAGRMVGWKGLVYAVEALARPEFAGLPVKLLLVGNGPSISALQTRAKQLGVAERIVFHPAVPHRSLPDFYAASDIGIFPSIGDEAFGITIAEAMSCGKAVIASHIGGIPEVVGNEGNCGILVPPGGVVALARAIRKLVDSPQLRQQMGGASRIRIESLFTWDHAAQRLLGAIDLPCD
jgi:glycosyltransferase involved in cell wall biosynthesis